MRYRIAQYEPRSESRLTDDYSWRFNSFILLNSIFEKLIPLHV